MKRGIYRPLTLLAVVAAFGVTGQGFVLTAGAAAQSAGNDEPPAVRFVLYPSAEPRPALKYQFLPGILDRRPGNAAVHYGKVTAEQMAFFTNAELWKNIHKWMNAPLEDLRRDDVYRQTRWGSIYDTLERAARCENCDWDLPIREQLFYTILLPEVQQTRTFARLLAAKARAEIAEGKFDEAVATLQIGYALGRDVAEAPTLVTGLVGVAICHLMCQQVREFIRQPDAPNLYWALTSLPTPLIDMRKGADAEVESLYLSFPELRHVGHPTQAPEDWQRSFGRLRALAADWDDDPTLNNPIGWVGRCMKGYPMAKRALIARGLPPEEVEAMPVPQVIAVYSMQTYEELRDDLFKWFHLPYWEARPGMERAEERLRQASVEGREILPVAGSLLPAIIATRGAVARLQREVALLRTLEALRIYGAAHQNRLPGTLADVTEVPIPDDPITGRPFEYTLQTGTALITGPPMPGNPLRMEIKLVGP